MNYRGISLRDLQYVDAVAAHGHFGRAAEACAVSQPALSAQIRKVEDALGLAIFERGNRSVVITGAGAEVLRRIQVVLVEAAAVFETAQALGEPLSGPFRLGAIATVGPYLFRHLLAPLRRRFPSLDLNLREGMTHELVADLRAGMLDAVILSPPIDAAGLRLEALYFESFSVAAPTGHPILQGAPPTPEGLALEDLLLLRDGHCLRDQTLGFCGQAERPGNPRPQAASLETLRQMVASGAGYSLLPALAIESEGDARGLGGLVAYRDFAADRPVGRTVSLAWRRRAPREAEHRLLADFIRDHPPPGVTPRQGSDMTETRTGTGVTGS